MSEHPRTRLPASPRTWDPDLRRERHARLLRAAAAADDAARTGNLIMRVSGSLSRGQTHPWSDLDLVLSRAGAVLEADVERTAVWNVIDATGMNDFQVDVVMEDEIIEPLRAGLIGSAIPLSSVPPLGDLPDPELALPRCAVSMETMIPHVRKALDYSFPAMADEDDDVLDYMATSALCRERDRLAHRVGICLKRLAVFQDGGASGWLDEDMAELPKLLERLTAPASEPYERPAVLTRDVGRYILWLLETEGNSASYVADDGGIVRADAKELCRDLRGAADALEGWARHLRVISSLTETHGLSPRM